MFVSPGGKRRFQTAARFGCASCLVDARVRWPTLLLPLPRWVYLEAWPGVSGTAKMARKIISEGVSKVSWVPLWRENGGSREGYPGVTPAESVASTWKILYGAWATDWRIRVWPRQKERKELFSAGQKNASRLTAAVKRFKVFAETRHKCRTLTARSLPVAYTGGYNIRLTGVRWCSAYPEHSQTPGDVIGEELRPVKACPTLATYLAGLWPPMPASQESAPGCSAAWFV